MDNTSNMNNGSAKTCKCGKHGGHKHLGWMLIIFGALFLAGEMQWLGQEIVDVTWPILLIILGIKKLYTKHKCMCARKS